MVHVVQDLDSRGVRVCTSGGSDGNSGMVLVRIHSVGVVSTLEALNIPEATFEKCTNDAGEAVICISKESAVKGQK
jgi:hypothetical protein